MLAMFDVMIGWLGPPVHGEHRWSMGCMSGVRIHFLLEAARSPVTDRRIVGPIGVQDYDASCLAYMY